MTLSSIADLLHQPNGILYAVGMALLTAFGALWRDTVKSREREAQRNDALREDTKEILGAIGHQTEVIRSAFSDLREMLLREVIEQSKRR
jgi:hypothetical protein